MKTRHLLLSACCLILAAPAAHAATMASQPWVTNRIAEAEARVDEQIAAATNAIPAPDYSTGNAALVATIEATAPAPGDYETVSNRAMSAAIGQTNLVNRALGRFSSTGSVARAAAYGTPTRWTDATGCVWEVGLVLGTPVSDTPGAVWLSYEYWPDDDRGKAFMKLNGVGWEQYANLPEGWASFTFNGEASKSDYSEGTLPYDVTFVRRLEVPVTNLVGRVAMTSEIPDVSGYATPADVTAAIREQSLGGIWDSHLGVWWTPIMENGALRYVATTNVNLNAEN